MGRIIKKFDDGSFFEYDNGKIDNWCVYITEPGQARKPPLDRDYFSALKLLAQNYGAERVYEDFVDIYNHTTKDIDNNVLAHIKELSVSYDDKLNVEKIFTLFYMVMTSEENYPGTKLGRKIKRLAAYEILFCGRDIDDAVNFMKGMNWKQINDLCEQRGF